MMRKSLLILVSAVLWSAAAYADDNNTTPAPAATPTPIVCDVPPYNDHGVIMAPLRSICDALGLVSTYNDGIVTVQTKPTDKAALRILTVRVGGQSAEVNNGGEHHSIKLPAMVEERLDTVFVPLKPIAEAFDTTVDGLTLKTADRVCVLTPPTIAAPAGKSATVSILNHLHHALSLHLSGPQKVPLELGSGESILLHIAPGQYNYDAACSGMQARHGSRQFNSDRKITWVWGNE